MDAVATERTSHRIVLVRRFVRGVLTVLIPLVLTLINVRVVMTPLYLEFEYNRPGFPEDAYGFTTEDRLHYAPLALNYLLNDSGIEYLGDLTFPDGAALYNERELKHMADVKVVVRAAFALLGLSILLIVGTLILAWKQSTFRQSVRVGLLQGALLTIGIIVGLVVLAVTMWDVFFTGFHQLLFESGTWRFYFSDTLIRLFPEQFWFDAAVIIGTMTLGQALLLAAISWIWGRTVAT